MGQLTRQQFLQRSAAAIATASLGVELSASEKLPRITLGGTGHVVTRLGLGGQGVLQRRGRFNEKKARAVIDAALQAGITYFDSSRLYGPSENYLGAGLRHARKQIFLATKSHARAHEYDRTMRHLETSLRNLKTDYLDLWQFHMADMQSAAAIHKGGKLKALRLMKEQGVVKQIGITGHWDAKRYARLLEMVDVDTALIAFNVADVHHRSFKKHLLPHLLSRKTGIIAMKVMLKGRAKDAATALNYVLSHPVHVALVGVDNEQQLLQNVAITKGHEPMSVKKIKTLEKQARGLRRYLVSHCLRRK